MGQYTQIIQQLRASFASGKTKTYEWRISQLTALLKMFKENEDKVMEVLYKDLHKPRFESSAMETNLVQSEIVNTINNLHKWMEPQKVAKDPMYLMDSAYIQRESLGVTLIIGAWNYPIQLTILPLVGAIAGGNCAILKPSELSEHTATFLEEYLPKYLDQDCFKIINGAVPETTELLSEKFDLIFYTGNGAVGKIVLTAAAKHLTPVILELGGKSPVYIDETSDLKTTSKRLAWGKFANSGQTCIAPDYVLCTKEIQEEFITKMKETLTEFYTEHPQKSDSYARIVNQRHFQRIKKMKEGCNVAIGGEEDETEQFIAPTIIRDVKLSDPIMQDEIFGPLLPIVPIKDVAEAFEIINGRDKPLSLYVFSTDKKIINDFRDKTSSGALVINDVVIHGGLATLPFGGIGGSGMGAYHGKFSFDSFTHPKPVLERSQALEKVNDIRYPPYSEKKLSWINWLMSKKVKKRGVLSFLPFMVIGTMFAMFFKTLGVTALATDAKNK